MVKRNLKLRSQVILHERIKSFVEDGYFVVVSTNNPTYAFFKLRHRLNGNIIVISAEPMRNTMIQRTNGQLTYQGQIQP